MLRTGILLPRSSLFPAFGLDILNGIKACLKQAGISDDIRLLTDNIGFGIEEAEIYTKAERLLLQEDADVVIVVADLSVGELLEPLFTTSNKLLILLNMGAGIPDTWKAAPTTIVHSLNLSFHARLTAKLAATENENKKGMYVLSYYDAGYRQTFSMLNSHQQNGGEPMFTHITHLKAEQFTLSPAEQFVEEHNDVRTWLCLFTGEMAGQFCEAVVPLQEKWKLNIYASVMLLENCFERTDRQAAIPELKGYTCWLSSLDNSTNTNYKSAFKKAAGKDGTLFGVLGWEAGLLLQEISSRYKQEDATASGTVAAIGEMKFESPRGWMKLDPATNHTYAPAWLVSLSQNGADKRIGEMTDTTEEWALFTAEQFPPDSNSGWRNTFLCI